MAVQDPLNKGFEEEEAGTHGVENIEKERKHQETEEVETHESHIAAPAPQSEKPDTDEGPIKTGKELKESTHEVETSATSTTYGSEFGDVKSDDGASVISSHNEDFPQLGSRGGYSLSKGRGRRQSYVAALASGQAVRQAGGQSSGQSRGQSRGQAGGQAGGQARGQTGGHDRGNSLNKDERKPGANDVWGVPTEEGAWGKGAKGSKKPA